MEINNNNNDGYRWYILILCMLTNCLASAVPTMCMPVLFDKISADLGLNLVQVGLIWGLNALPGIVTILIGGAAGDRFGPKRVLMASCLLIGVSGAMRGLAFDFPSLAATMLVFGMFTPFITMNSFKTCSLWFSSQQIGLASGVLSMGMALGFLFGSLFSATTLSPALGGWRQVLFLYGAISIALCVPWFFTRPAPNSAKITLPASPAPIAQAIAHVARIRNIWLLGLSILGVSGCIQGTLGYIPLYLRGQGWPAASADAALAAFHTISLVFVIPIALLSDKLRTRKKILIAATMMTTCGIGLLSVAQGAMVWVAVCMAGMARDGFMAVFMTFILETDGVGPAYAGTANGLTMVFSGLGNVIAPPIGNSLASINPGAPFVLWSAMTLFGFIGLIAAKERLQDPLIQDLQQETLPG
jgi:ACS family D-galactonate transporter-like MFS transporter